MSEKQKRLRRKLLGVLPRATLEDVSGMREANLADRTTLTESALAHWDGETLYVIQRYVNQAGEKPMPTHLVSSTSPVSKP